MGLEDGFLTRWEGRMLTKHPIRGVQTLLVLGALTFAVVGLAAPQQASQQRACASTRNPDPPCTCAESEDCWESCFIYCYGRGGVAYYWCQPSDPVYPSCEENGGNTGLCGCTCFGG